MKKWIIAAVVLVAVLLLAPFGFGHIAEKRVNAGLDKLVEQAPYLVIAERSWEAGWFTSSQTVTFELAEGFRGMMDEQMLEAAVAQAMAEAVAGEGATVLPEGPAPGEDASQDANAEAGAEVDTDPNAGADANVDSDARPSVIPERFVVHNAVLHGPVLGLSGIGVARLDTTLDLPETTRAKIREVFGPEPALSIRSRLGLFGGATTVMASKGRTLNLGEGASEGELSYADFRLVTRYDGEFDQYSMSGGTDRISLKGRDAGSAELSALTLEGHGERVQGDLYDAETALRLGELKIVDTTAREFIVADAHYIANVDSEDGFSRMAMQMGTGRVQSADVKAMGLEIREAHYDFSIRRLHTDTLVKIFGELKQAYARPVGTDAAALAQMLSGEIFAPFKENAAALLAHDPEFGVDRVGIVTADGEAVIQGVVKLKGLTTEDFSLTALPGLIGKIDAEFTVEAAQPLLEKLPNGAMVSGMALDMGYATREGDKLVSRIVFRDGALTINGKAMPIPGLGAPGVMPGAPQGELPVPEGIEPAVEM